VRKTLFGFKQALDSFLSQIGFVKCISENGVSEGAGSSDNHKFDFFMFDDLFITSPNERKN